MRTVIGLGSGRCYSGGGNVATTGQDVEMKVTAAGSEPFTYRWRKDGWTVARDAQSSLLLRSVTTNRTGLYSVIVANSAGSVTSSVVTLTVDLPDVGVRLQPRGSLDGFEVGVGSGAPVRIQIRGHHAFVADGWDDSLHVVDIRDPDEPRRVSGPYGNGAARAFDVVSKDTVAYMADGGLGVVALDLAQSPVQQLAQFGTGIWELALTDRYLWAVGGSLELFNVSTPEKVILLGSYLDRGKALGVLIRGNRLYMCERHFNIIDLEFVAMAPLVLSPTEERQVASGSDVVLEG